MASGVLAQELIPVLPLPAPLNQLPGTPFKLSIPAPPSTILWSIPLTAAPSAPPLVAGDRIALSSLPGIVSAFDMKDGREVWRETLVADQPLAADGELLFVAAGEAVHALRMKDGSAAWRVPTGTLTAPPLAKDGWLIAASATRLFALRASDGGVIWSVDNGPQRERAAISGDLLFVPLANGMLRALNLGTGTPRWERPFAGAPAEPLVIGDRLYFGATDKRFYCVDVAGGEDDWIWKVGSVIRGKASTDGERVFFAGLDNLVRAMNLGSGSQRWQQGVPFRPFTGPVVSGSAIFVAGPTTDVHILNPRNGKAIGKLSFPERLAVAPAFGEWQTRLVVVGVSGGLTEAWKLWLAAPMLNVQ